jgi:esterase/lipase
MVPIEIEKHTNYIMKGVKMENWEKELDENMESIRASYDSIMKSGYSIIGVMILWIGIEIGMML